ncbi:MAG: YqeG family HAD IIIA-type phosphatase [Gracilibacteraceae bacterium]|nr:YqeG family HAD IIIA-type phosphatase [Gracilibacteraceae bacterium]
MPEVTLVGRGLKPDFQFFAVTDFDSAWLRANRIKGLLLDMDNTIVPWRGAEVSAAVLAWARELRAGGLKACIVSNSRYPAKVARVGAALGFPYLHRARKPRQGGFRAGRALLGLGPEEVLVVGDQLFTDILGGNRGRMRTCLICPIARPEFIGTTLLRLLERAAGRPPGFQQNGPAITK